MEGRGASRRRGVRPALALQVCGYPNVVNMTDTNSTATGDEDSKKEEGEKKDDKQEGDQKEEKKEEGEKAENEEL